MSWLQGLIDRYVVHEGRPRSSLYREEAGRIRAGDRLSWIVILTGFLPLAAQNPVFVPVWIGLAVAWWVARKQGFLLGHNGATNAAAAAMATGLVYFGGTGDTLWAFILFLVLMAMVLIHKSDLEVEVPRLYLVAFTLFLVFAHLTLEYTFLVVLFAMVLSGILLMLRYHFPEQVRPGKYMETARALVRPVLAAMLITVPVFVLCPRVPIATLQIKRAPHTGGFSEKIKFGEMRGSLESERPFMTVRTPNGRKWRGIVLDFYDGQGWRRRDRRGTELQAGRDNLIWVDPRVRAQGKEAFESAEVILEPTDCRFYFSPRFPIALESEFSAVRHDGGRMLLRVEEPQAKRIRYQVWFGDTKKGPSALDTEDMGKFTQYLPSLKRIPALAKRVTAGATTNRQRAEMIDKFLAEGEYTYSLGGAPPPNVDPVEWFLFEAKTGHCEYYSSSMALMLRSLGVPARVVNGFNPGTFDPFSGTWVVRERNAHSWCEVFLDGEGWVEFDPTTGNGREQDSTLAQRMGLDQMKFYQVTMGVLNQLDFEWQRCVVSFSVSMQWGILKSLYDWLEDLEVRLRVWWNNVRVAKPSAIAGGLVFFAILVRLLRRRLAALLRRLWALLAPWLAWLASELARLRAGRRAAPEVGVFYHDLADLLERHGFARAKHETPWELARRISSISKSLGEAVTQVADAYARVAYRGQELTDGELAQVKKALAAVEAELLARAQAPAGGT